VAYPDEHVLDALHRMVKHNIGRLPVVSREDPRRMVGYFDRSHILSAWTRQVEEESVQEHGWYARWRRTT
jgi:predicted transcriptional regulator